MSSPQDSVPPMEKGKFQIRQHEFKFAEKSFLQEVENNPGNDEAWFLIGYCRRKLYRVAEAREPLEKAVSLNKEDPDYFYELAICYRNLGENEKAIETVKKLGSMNQDQYDTEKLLEMWEKKPL